MPDFIALEEQGWMVLSTGGAVVKAFYDTWLADDAVMVFPSGMLLDGKADILGAIDPQPWQSFRFDQPRVIWLSETAAVVVHGVTAPREGAAPYIALISSACAVRDEQWKLVVHQPTPA